MPQQNIITVGYYIIENNVGKLKKDNFIYNNRVDYIYTNRLSIKVSNFYYFNYVANITPHTQHIPIFLFDSRPLV